MRILHLIPRLSGGGAERQLSYLAPELASLGHDVHVAYRRDGPLKPSLQNVALHQLRSRSSYDPYLLWQFFRLVRAIKPDVINTWILQSDVIGAIAAKLSGTPWILRESNSAMAYPACWKHSLRVRAAASASAIICNSSGGDKYWESQLPASCRYIVPNSVPMDAIRATTPGFPFQNPKSGIPLVLYAGRLISDARSSRKNLKPLMHALARVKQTREVFAIICGDGPQMSELQELRRALQLQSDVFFTGYLPASAVWALMKMASVFVSLSDYEGRPNTVMEAMACGCPLVLSDIPAHREIVEEASAFFVNPANLQETADTITRALADTGEARRRAKVAQQKTQEWSITKMARQFEFVYKSVT